MLVLGNGQQRDTPSVSLLPSPSNRFHLTSLGRWLWMHFLPFLHKSYRPTVLADSYSQWTNLIGVFRISCLINASRNFPRRVSGFSLPTSFFAHQKSVVIGHRSNASRAGRRCRVRSAAVMSDDPAPLTWTLRTANCIRGHAREE
jgi:hypothetical protein